MAKLYRVMAKLYLTARTTYDNLSVTCANDRYRAHSAHRVTVGLPVGAYYSGLACLWTLLAVLLTPHRSEVKAALLVGRDLPHLLRAGGVTEPGQEAIHPLHVRRKTGVVDLLARRGVAAELDPVHVLRDRAKRRHLRRGEQRGGWASAGGHAAREAGTGVRKRPAGLSTCVARACGLQPMATPSKARTCPRSPRRWARRHGRSWGGSTTAT